MGHGRCVVVAAVGTDVAVPLSRIDLVACSDGLRVCFLVALERGFFCRCASGFGRGVNSVDFLGATGGRCVDRLGHGCTGAAQGSGAINSARFHRAAHSGWNWFERNAVSTSLVGVSHHCDDWGELTQSTDNTPLCIVSIRHFVCLTRLAAKASTRKAA